MNKLIVYSSSSITNTENDIIIICFYNVCEAFPFPFVFIPQRTINNDEQYNCRKKMRQVQWYYKNKINQ